jgi:hypothetical protein
MPRVTITVPDKNAQPYRFQLDRQVVTLGRGSENDIAIDCGSVSVKHAEMVRIEGGYELRDVGSTNGIKLEGERKSVIPLRNGATVKLGDVAFDFQLSDEEREALAREKPPTESPIVREPEESGSEKPERRPERKPVPARPTLVTQPSGSGFGMVVLFFILAAAAFFTGLAIRHSKETGGSLLDAMGNKGKTPAPAAEQAPAAPPAPAAPAAE